MRERKIPEWLKKLLSGLGITISTVGELLNNPMAKALGISLSAHALVIEPGSFLSRALGVAGLVVGVIGFATGDPFLGALGISLAVHSVIVDLASPFGKPQTASPPPKYSVEVTIIKIEYIGEHP